MKLTAFLEGIGIGALAMFLADPDGGNRRRAMIRDQVVSQANRKRKAIDVMTRDFTNRARGMQYKMKGKMDSLPGGISTDSLSNVHMPTGEDVTNMFKQQWTPATCLMAGVGGVMMFLVGMGKKGMTGGFMQVAGVGLVAKAFHDVENRYPQSNQNSQFRDMGDQPQFSTEDGMEGEPVTDRGQAGML